VQPEHQHVYSNFILGRCTVVLGLHHMQEVSNHNSPSSENLISHILLTTSAIWLWKLSRMNVLCKHRMASNQHCHTHTRTSSTLPHCMVHASYYSAPVLYVCFPIQHYIQFQLSTVCFVTRHHSNELILMATLCDCYCFFISVVKICV
jgi:hypothetical protein